MVALLTTLILCIIASGTLISLNHHNRKLWLMQRQWNREDREARIRFEHEKMERALKSLHE